MKNKLAWGYTVVFTILFSLGFTTVYIISQEYREEEFYQRLKDRMFTTYRLLVQVEQIDHNLLQIFDKNTINNLHDEKILLFNSKGQLIYNSIDDTKIEFSNDILQQLMHGDVELKLSDGKYEILALQFKNKNEVFYGIAKAYDRFGRSKIEFLKDALIIVAITVNLVLVFASLGLSKLVLAPISRLTEDVESISPKNLSDRICEPQPKDEINILARKFNELLDKIENIYKFQYHFVHHVSHELKTPLSVMMANVEGALAKGTPDAIKQSLTFQKNNLMGVAHIVNAMLDISKTENQLVNTHLGIVRIDELLFECVDEISYLNAEAHVHFIIDETIDSSDKLTIKGNNRMLKMALNNLLSNSLNYAKYSSPYVQISLVEDYLMINICNDGEIISEEDQKKLFTHFFRGVNSAGKRGFGLGLVLVQRIIALHFGTISYSAIDGKNSFTIKLPWVKN